MPKSWIFHNKEHNIFSKSKITVDFPIKSSIYSGFSYMFSWFSKMLHVKSIGFEAPKRDAGAGVAKCLDTRVRSSCACDASGVTSVLVH